MIQPFTEKCYIKKICDTESQEGQAFLLRFKLDLYKCRFCCYGTNVDCRNYITSQEAERGGLVKLMKK